MERGLTGVIECGPSLGGEAVRACVPQALPPSLAYLAVLGEGLATR